MRVWVLGLGVHVGEWEDECEGEVRERVKLKLSMK